MGLTAQSLVPPSRSKFLRDALLRKLLAVAGFDAVIAKFEAVGASRPVYLLWPSRSRAYGAEVLGTARQRIDGRHCGFA